MEALFRFPNAVRESPDVEGWFGTGDPMRRMLEPWLEELRRCGPDVQELIHDGRPTICAQDVAFAYLDAFAAHANLGFFYGAVLDDPAGLLQGAGKRMRHVKLHWGRPPNAAALRQLIASAYADIRPRVEESGY